MTDTKPTAVDALAHLHKELAGWIEAAKENHEANGHRSERIGRECWNQFGPDDITRMIADTARALDITDAYKDRLNEQHLSPTCIVHRSFPDQCQRYADTVANPCTIVDLPVADGALLRIQRRRDDMLARAGDSGEWTDPDTGRRYVSFLTSATFEKLNATTIRCTVPTAEPAWWYIASELLDVDMPDRIDGEIIEPAGKSHADLTWKLP